MNDKHHESKKLNMTFEQALKRLEQLVQKISSGEMELEKMIEAFEEGRDLLNFCSTKLNEVEKKIEIITRENGKLNFKPFPEEDSNGTGSS